VLGASGMSLFIVFGCEYVVNYFSFPLLKNSTPLTYSRKKQLCRFLSKKQYVRIGMTKNVAK
jgi:hypothetical protein